MRKILLSLFILLNCSACDTISGWFNDESQKSDPLYESIKDMYDAYNKKQLDRYIGFFTEDVNVFKEQGLGNTRIIYGKNDFRFYYERVFRTKRTLKITPLDHFSVPPWVMVKEMIDFEDRVFEVIAGYRVIDGKVRDRMLLSERIVIDKTKFSPTIPKGNQAPPPLTTMPNSN